MKNTCWNVVPESSANEKLQSTNVQSVNMLLFNLLLEKSHFSKRQLSYSAC
ncbi:hypothetical protein BN1088_1170008 [Sphingobacterium sp. PM2-P1-29]|nr:hypothetical protein BN1088_1170008 [Sphingobacterium sp. PM2-P1-29]